MKTSYEIQTLQRGRWKIASIFDDMELAVYEAKRMDNAGRFSGVRVVQEDVEGNPFATEVKAKLSVVFSSGNAAGMTPRPQPLQNGSEAGPGGMTPPPIPDIPELSPDGEQVSQRGGRSGGGQRRRKRKRKSDNTLFYVALGALVFGVGFALGAVLLLGR